MRLSPSPFRLFAVPQAPCLRSGCRDTFVGPHHVHSEESDVSHGRVLHEERLHGHQNQDAFRCGAENARRLIEMVAAVTALNF